MAGPGGQPTKFKEDYIEQVYRLCLLGLIDEELAKAFDVTPQTLGNWKHAHPEFFEAIKRGRLIADGNVIASLYDRANGYTHKEDKIFCSATGDVTVVPTEKHYPPDPTSMIFWLKNRQPAKWRDRVPENVNDADEVKPVSIEFVVKDGKKKD